VALKKLLPLQRNDFIGVFRRWTASRSPSARWIRRCTSSCRAAKTDGRHCDRLEITKPKSP
jgi:hypothetical protein